MQSNDGTLDDARIMLGHRSADTTAKHYVGNSQTESQRAMAEQIGHKQIQDILRIGDELKSKLGDLEELFGDLPHFTVHDDGSLTWPHMDGDDDQLKYRPDEIDTSGPRFKSGSGDQSYTSDGVAVVSGLSLTRIAHIARPIGISMIPKNTEVAAIQRGVLCFIQRCQIHRVTNISPATI